MEYEGQVFENLQLSSDLIEDGQFSDCQFIKCEFFELKIDNCTFRNCAFHGCTLLNNKYKYVDAANNIFENCNLTGVDWSDVMRKQNRLLPFLSLKDCTIKHNYFYMLSMKNFDFKECDLTGTIFEQCNLSGSSFRRARLSETKFDNNDLRKVDFRDAVDYAISPENNKLKGARFSFPEAISLLEVMGIIVE